MNLVKYFKCLNSGHSLTKWHFIELTSYLSKNDKNYSFQIESKCTYCNKIILKSIIGKSPDLYCLISNSPHDWTEWKFCSDKSCKQTRECKNCNYIQTQIVHNWKEWDWEENKYGWKERICNRCCEKEEINIAKTCKHDWGQWEPIKSRKGWANRICKKCNLKEEEDISKTCSHDWDDWKNLESCTKIRICKKCGIDEIRNGLHEWSDWKEVSKNCCDWERICINCNDKELYTYHDWSQWEWLSNESCDKIKVCRKCNIEEKMPNVHDFKKRKLNDDKCEQEYECKRCKLKEIKLEHDWEDTYKADWQCKLSSDKDKMIEMKKCRCCKKIEINKFLCISCGTDSVISSDETEWTYSSVYCYKCHFNQYAGTSKAIRLSIKSGYLQLARINYGDMINKHWKEKLRSYYNEYWNQKGKDWKKYMDEKWGNYEKYIEQLRKLIEIENISNQYILFLIATNDLNEKLSRIEAAKKLTDKKTAIRILCGIVQYEKMELISEHTASKILKDLCEIFFNEESEFDSDSNYDVSKMEAVKALILKVGEVIYDQTDSSKLSDLIYNMRHDVNIQDGKSEMYGAIVKECWDELSGNL